MLDIQFQAGQILNRCFPYHEIIYSNIIVCEFISHPSNLAPGDLRISFSNINWDSFGGFSDDFQTANDGKLSLVILRELVIGQPIDKTGYLFDRFQNIVQIV